MHNPFFFAYCNVYSENRECEYEPQTALLYGVSDAAGI